MNLNTLSLAVAALAALLALYWLWRARSNCPELERIGRITAGDPYCRAPVDQEQCGLISGHTCIHVPERLVRMRRRA